MGNAVAIMVGQALGADDVERAKNCTWRLMVLAVGSNLIMGTMARPARAGHSGDLQHRTACSGDCDQAALCRGGSLCLHIRSHIAVILRSGRAAGP